MKKIATLLGSGLAIATLSFNCYAQDIAPEDKPAKIANPAVKIIERALPTGGEAWTKIIVSFDSVPTWSDGIFVMVDVLLTNDQTGRVASARARLNNIKKGRNEVPFYLSPRTTERFGRPRIVQGSIVVGEGDEDVYNFEEKTSDSGRISEDWRNEYAIFQGLLLNMYQTPWMAYDAGYSPDFAFDVR